MKSIFLIFTCTLLAYGQFDQYLFVGTYTSQDSKGVYVYAFNSKTAAYQLKSIASGGRNPSFLAFSPNSDFVYSGGDNTERQGTVNAYKFDKLKGELRFINAELSHGISACHVAVDATGRWVIVANYVTGTVSVLPINQDGSVGQSVQTIKHEGNGPMKGRQDSPHAHSVYIAANNEDVQVVDLGTDKIVKYKFNVSSGLLSPNGFIAADPGTGPRHLAFSNGRTYSVNELASSISIFKNDRLVSTVSALPDGSTEQKWAADIHFSPDGKFLYSSNRGADNIAVFRVNRKTGGLTLLANTPTEGKTPRNFMISPDGRFVLVANQESNNIVVFNRNKKTGLLLKHSVINTPTPVCLKMIPQGF